MEKMFLTFLLCTITCCSIVILGAADSAHTSINCSKIKNITRESSNSSLGDILTDTVDLNCSVIVLQSPQYLFKKINVSKVHDLTIKGEAVDSDRIQVMCSNLSGLSFWAFEQVNLEGLDFIGCGVIYELPEVNSSSNSTYSVLATIGIYFQSGNSFTLANCKFDSSPGVGVLGNDVAGFVGISKSNFSLGEGGLVIHTSNQTGGDHLTCLIDSCEFVQSHNLLTSKYNGGGVTVVLEKYLGYADVTIQGTMFLNNMAKSGGGLHVSVSSGNLNLTVSAGSRFVNNTALTEGGGSFLACYSPAIAKIHIMEVVYSTNSAHRGGGLAVVANSPDYGAATVYASDSNWNDNCARRSGTGVYLKALPGVARQATNSSNYSLVANFDDCGFTRNRIESFRDIGAFYAESVILHHTSCTFYRNKGAALYLQSASYSTFSGSLVFQENFGIKAAAIFLSYDSALNLAVNVEVSFAGNTAHLDQSGTIYMESYPSAVASNHTSYCIFENLNYTAAPGVYKVSFVDNKVENIDRSIFIEDTYKCIKNGNNILRSDSIFIYSPDTPSQVASVAEYVSIASTKHSVMPGQTFQIMPSVRDEFGNPSSIQGYLTLLSTSINDSCDFFCNSSYDLVGPTRLTLDESTETNSLFYLKGNYTDVATRVRVAFLFNINGDFLGANREFTINVIGCLPGFAYSSDENVCKCSSFDNDNFLCNEFAYSCIKSGYWYGVNSNGGMSASFPCPRLNCQYNETGCNKMLDCPSSPGYCKLDSLTEQCNSGRKGILCSYCQPGYSFSFGALQCVNTSTCTGLNTSMITLGILLYWVLSITFIFMVLTLNLSIGSGFMYGIIYYFSVITLYTDSTINDMFLATLVYSCTAFTQMSPRVIGHVPICFAESWNRNLHHYIFEYVTPIFITTFIILLMASSRLCRWPKRFSFAENSPIHAVCILILFSSSSLAYTTFEILRPLPVFDYVGVYRDPHYIYFGKDHLPYVVAAIAIEIFISLPICILFLFSPLISRKVDLVKWKLKPIVDEFQACYKPERRWFAGFYFAARQVAFLIHAFYIRAESSPQDNIILQYFNVIILLLHVSLQPYKSKLLNAIDAFLLVDVLMMSMPMTASPLSLDQRIHHVILYFLILLPSIYLMGIFIGLVTIRLYIFTVGLFRTKIPSRVLVNEKLFAPPSTATPTQTTLDIQKMSESTESDESFEPVRNRSALENSFFVDDGEREPLLARSHESHTDTHTSLRLSTMASFPRLLTSSRRLNRSTSTK